MSKSARLRTADARAVYELVGQCRDLGDDPAAWWVHFSCGIARRIGCDFVAAGQVTGPDQPSAWATPPSAGVPVPK